MSSIARTLLYCVKPVFWLIALALLWASCIFDSPDKVPLYTKDTITNTSTLSSETTWVAVSDTSWLVLQQWNSLPATGAESLLFIDTLYKTESLQKQQTATIQTQILIRQQKGNHLLDTLKTLVKIDTTTKMLDENKDSTTYQIAPLQFPIHVEVQSRDIFFPSMIDTIKKTFNGKPYLSGVQLRNPILSPQKQDSIFEFTYLDTIHTWEIHRSASFKVQYRERTWTRKHPNTMQSYPFYSLRDTLKFPDSSSLVVDTSKNTTIKPKIFYATMRWNNLSDLPESTTFDSLRPAIKIAVADSKFVSIDYSASSSISLYNGIENAILTPTLPPIGSFESTSTSSIFHSLNKQIGNWKWWQCIYTHDGNVKIVPVSIRQTYKNFYPVDSTLIKSWDNTQAKRLAGDDEIITLSTSLENATTSLDSIARLRSKFALNGDFSVTVQFRHSRSNGTSATSAVVVSSLQSLGYFYTTYAPQSYLIPTDDYSAGFFLYSQNAKTEVVPFSYRKSDVGFLRANNFLPNSGFLKIERKGGQIYLSHRAETATVWSAPISYVTESAPVYLHFMLGDYDKANSASAQLELSHFEIEQGSITWP